MKRILIFSSIFLFLITTPVLAKKDADRGNGSGNHISQQTETEEEIEIEEECDPEGIYKNHGQYVSCAAKLKQGGAAVSAAAQSDIGKKSEAGPAPVASPAPSGSPSASPSPSVSPSGSPAGIGTTGVGVKSAKIEIGALIEVLQNIIKSLQNLMTN